MTQHICWGCGTVFQGSFVFNNICNVCRQTEVIKKQMKSAQHQYSEPSVVPAVKSNFTFVPDYNSFSDYAAPAQSDLLRQQKLRKIDKIFSLGVVLSIFVAWAIIWLVTSGWVTFFGFVAAIYLPFYFHKQHHLWQIKNAKHLYQI